MVKFRANATKVEINEFWCLVKECLEKEFKTSKEVTNYILKNKLGFKYRHIAGKLTFRRGNDSWIYEGGISPEYYGKLCRELNLGNKASDARVERFRSYAQLEMF